MAHFLKKRILLSLLQIFIVCTVVFSLIRIMPGDPAVLALGTDHAVDKAAVEAMRKQLGLDRPLIIQYVSWMGGLLRLDLGNSTMDGSTVLSNIMQRLPRTLELATVAIIIATVIGVLLGLISALKRNSIFDRILTSISVCGISVPVYVLGALLIVFFSLKMKWLPSGGYVDFSENPIKHIIRLILPAFTIALGVSASIARMTRSSMLEVLDREYIKTIRAKGLPESTVIVRHALRNALIPIVTIIGLQFGNLIGGTVLVENLFSWPGINTLLVTSIGMRDYPIIQGCILAVSVIYIFVNLIVDILYGMLDPRIS